MDIHQLYTLLKKYREQRCTSEEEEELNRWYDQFYTKIDALPGIPQEKSDVLWEGIEQRIYLQQRKRMFRRWRFMAVAAVIVLIGWVSGNYMIAGWQENIQPLHSEGEILPGHLKAVLTLANGSEIALDRNTVVKESHGLLMKTDSLSLLDYTNVDSLPSFGYHTISVPLGGEYRLILSDGSRIWLNSQSVLKYPVVFAGDKREVILAGEGYFQVAKKEIPFIVKTSDVDVQVLGTSFNISAYTDDRYVTTTLVNGKVIVHDPLGEDYEMQPGHLLSYEKETRHVRSEVCDTDLYTSWINGKFRFRDMRLEDIMIRLNRWYNCEFFYQQAAIKDLRFTGAAEKDRPIGYLLEMIETVTDVHFEIKGKTVVLK